MSRVASQESISDPGVIYFAEVLSDQKSAL